MPEALPLDREVPANPGASVTGMSSDEVSEPFPYFIFAMLGPKRLTNNFCHLFFVAIFTRSIYFFTHV